MSLLVGAHVSSAGGLSSSWGKAAAMGAECFQTHPANPQRLRPLGGDPLVVSACKDAALAYPNLPHFFHAPYLVSLATPALDAKQQAHLRVSIDILVSYLKFADSIGVSGVIFHTNSHLKNGFEYALPQIRAALQEILERAESQSQLLIENCAGEGGKVGSFEEVSAILEGFDQPNLGMCLDTCHAFASGYDLASQKAVDTTIHRLAELGLLHRISAVHANDSKDILGNNADRHENIGDGYIGNEGFTALLQDPVLSTLPWILEVPGHQDNLGKKSGPDKDNINRLRSLASRPLIP